MTTSQKQKMTQSWSLHPQLERDTANIGDLPL
jgi:hypothetical protein